MENWRGKPKRQVLREFAQDELLHSLDAAFLSIEEGHTLLPEGHTKEDVLKEMRKQENRIRRMFGFEID